MENTSPPTRLNPNYIVLSNLFDNFDEKINIENHTNLVNINISSVQFSFFFLSPACVALQVMLYLYNFYMHQLLAQNYFSENRRIFYKFRIIFIIVLFSLPCLIARIALPAEHFFSLVW